MFQDRSDAGDQLIRLLTRYRCHPKGLVLGIPRGGAVVGARIASELGLPFGVFISLTVHPRRIAAPLRRTTARAL